MFKLIKIQNAGRNVPEIEKLQKLSSSTIKAGEALFIEDGFAKACPVTTVPTHIAFADAAYGTNDVICYPISGDMLFETTINASPSGVYVGSKVTLGKDSGSSSVCVTATTTSGVATVVDLMKATAVGDKITVKF